MKMIDNAHTSLLAKMMDVYALRNKTTAANIANIDTPGYKRQRVDFEAQLAQKLDSGTISRHEVSEMRAEVRETDMKPELEEELIEMSDTQLRVQLVTRALRHNYEQLRMGIIGRAG